MHFPNKLHRAGSWKSSARSQFPTHCPREGILAEYRCLAESEINIGSLPVATHERCASPPHFKLVKGQLLQVMHFLRDLTAVDARGRRPSVLQEILHARKSNDLTQINMIDISRTTNVSGQRGRHPEYALTGAARAVETEHCEKERHGKVQRAETPVKLRCTVL